MIRLTGSQWLTIAGLTLTLAGAAILSITDLRGQRRTTWDDVYRGIPRLEARIAFPLIAVGSALQIAGVAVS
jgi:hypothetical protein